MDYLKNEGFICIFCLLFFGGKWYYYIGKKLIFEN